MINAAYDIHDDDPAFGYRLIADEAALHGDTRTYNQPLTALRAPTERAHALLGHWRALDRVTLCLADQRHRRRRTRAHVNAARPLVRKPHR